MFNVSIVSGFNSSNPQLEKEDETNEVKSYRGYKLVQVIPKDEQQLKLVQTSFDDESGEVIK